MSEYKLWREKRAIRAAFPVLFQGERHPWKIGIWKDIIEARPDLDTPKMKEYVRQYTHGTKYLTAVVAGRARVDVSGQCGDIPAPEHTKYARRTLDKRVKK